MSKTTPLINIFTYRLPWHIAQPMYSEFDNRFSEAKRLIAKYQQYSALKDEIETVESLLVLSIFYKRVVANLDAALKFYGLVYNASKASAIRIGSYELNGEEVIQIRKLVDRFQILTSRYQVSELWNYDLTLDFLKRLIDLKQNPDE